MGFNVFRIFLLSMLAEAADHPPAFQGAVETLMVVVLQATGSLRC